MSRRALLVVTVLTVLAMAGGAGAGILLGRVDAGRREAAPAPSATEGATVPAAPQTSAPTTAPPSTTAAPATTGTAAPTTLAASTSSSAPSTTTGPPRLSARLASRLADGIVVRLDASQPLTQAVLRFGTGGRLDQTRRISGTVRHGTVTLPLPDDQTVTIQVSGRTSAGILVRSNTITGQRLPS